MKVHRLLIPIMFPEGVSPGEGSGFNSLTVARDGQDHPVLRGTALAGVLRHTYARAVGGHAAEHVQAIFGGDVGKEAGTLKPSRLEVADCVIQCGEVVANMRPHNQINRHTGTTVQGALLTIEALPPGCTADVVLWLREESDLPEAAETILRRIAGFFRTGLLLGGRAARGVGRAILREAATYRVYDLTTVADHAAYLDDHRAWRGGQIGAISPGTALTTDGEEDGQLRVEFTLVIPRGQDLLVAAGGGTDAEQAPQEVVGADKRPYWRLPGSTLRGLFRAWMSRLAAREGHPVAYSLERHRQRRDKVTGEEIGWCFTPEEQRSADERPLITCPVGRLFGSLAARGRIHISDAYAPVPIGSDKREGTQLRRHVAIDRVTGGASEGALFDNIVLVGGISASPEFHVTMMVNSPSADEARWLAQSIRALDVGVIRVGSSKAAGRLCLRNVPTASGPFADQFTSITPSVQESEVRRG